MNASEAAALLQSESSHDRRLGARFFESNSSPEHRSLLTERLAVETDTWTRRALVRGLEAVDQSSRSQTDTDEEEAFDGEGDATFLQALGRATNEVVHELRPILGILRVAAAREIKNYEGSRTRVQVDRVSAALRAFDEINKASELVSRELIDLSQVVGAVLEEFAGLNVEPAGPPALSVNGNAGLIEMALRNGVRNAVEATSQTGSLEPVVVSWNRSDGEAWISVLDRGSGLPDRRTHIFRIGSSTKKGHLGFGLALARRCAKSLHGVLTVRSRDGGGTAFELRWPAYEIGDEDNHVSEATNQ
jgi:signal transduction histidine kinase